MKKSVLALPLVAAISMAFASTSMALQPATADEDSELMPLVDTPSDPDQAPPYQQIVESYSEFSISYWHAEGGVDWSHDTGSPIFGDPTSRLDWRDVPLHFITMTGKWLQLNNDGHSDFQYLRIGGGVGDGGTIQDDDWLSPEAASELGGPALFSRTHSEIRNGESYTLAGGFGRRLPVGTLGFSILDIYTGLSVRYEEYDAYGAKVLADPYGLYDQEQKDYLGNPKLHVLTMETQQAAWEIGAEFHRPFGLGFELIGNFMASPVVGIRAYDTHVLRQDLAGKSRFDVTGFGYSGDLALGYRFDSNVVLKAGYRLEGFRDYDGDLRMKARYSDGSTMSETFDLVQFHYDRGGPYIEMSGQF